MEAHTKEIQSIEYETYEDSRVKWIGKIPAHWKLFPGFMVVDEQCRKNIGLIENTVLSLSYGSIVIKEEDKLTGLVPESFETYQIVNPNDIIIRTMDLQNDKTSLRIGMSEYRGIISSAYLNLKVREGFCPKYVYYFLHTVDITKVIYGLGSGLRQNLSYLDLRRFLFLAPPIQEQTLIARFLDRKTAQIDKAIAQKEKLIELLKERRQILIHNAVTKGLNTNVKMKDSGVEWIGEIPEHWHLTQIKRVASTTSGGTPSSGNVRDYYGGTIPWVRTTDLNDDELFEVPEKITKKALRETACKLVPINTVCVAMYGGSGTIGKHAILRFSGTLNQAVCGIIPSANLGAEYLFYYVKFCRPHWMITAKGSRVDPNINQDEVKKMFITLPPDIEQKQISMHIHTVIDKTAQAIALNTNYIEKLDVYKATLINGAVTGKIKVPDLETMD